MPTVHKPTYTHMSAYQWYKNGGVRLIFIENSTCWLTDQRCFFLIIKWTNFFEYILREKSHESYSIIIVLQIAIVESNHVLYRFEDSSPWWCHSVFPRTYKFPDILCQSSDTDISPNNLDQDSLVNTLKLK